MRLEKKRQGDYAEVTGWFTHPRQMRKYKDSCNLKPDSEIAKMRHHELRAHLMELELLEESEEKMKEKDTRKVEIISEGEPEKKKRKKEKKMKKRKRRRRRSERKKRRSVKQKKLRRRKKRKRKKRRGKKPRSSKSPFGEKPRQFCTATYLSLTTGAPRKL